MQAMMRALEDRKTALAALVREHLKTHPFVGDRIVIEVVITNNRHLITPAAKLMLNVFSPQECRVTPRQCGIWQPIRLVPEAVYRGETHGQQHASHWISDAAKAERRPGLRSAILDLLTPALVLKYYGNGSLNAFFYILLERRAT